jgi:hypothetical protein
MTTLKRIVFFWTGQDVTLPSLLVFSIRRHFGAQFEVVQISDRTTPRVSGTSHHKTLNLSPSIMVARLEAYASMAVSEPTLYLDADMLVLRAFDLPDLAAGEIGLTLRTSKDNGFITPESTDGRKFPEFRGKTLLDVMPYIYAFVYTRSEVIFLRQLIALRKAPKRFHDWYGDQVTLKKELDRKKFTVRHFDGNTYNRTIATRMEYEELCAAPEPPCIVHFKGPYAKEALLEVGCSLGVLRPARVR